MQHRGCTECHRCPFTSPCSSFSHLLKTQGLSPDPCTGWARSDRESPPSARGKCKEFRYPSLPDTAEGHLRGMARALAPFLRRPESQPPAVMSAPPWTSGCPPPLPRLPPPSAPPLPGLHLDLDPGLRGCGGSTQPKAAVKSPA